MRGISTSCLSGIVAQNDRDTQRHWWAEKRDPVGTPLPTSDEKYDLQPHVRCANAPPKFFSRVELQSVEGFCRIVSSRELPHCASPLSIVHLFLRKIKRFAEILSEAIGIFSREKQCAYQFIAEYQHEYPITVMCRVLEVSVSGYYAWRKREASLHSREDAQLAQQVKTAFQANRHVYGSPRVHAELRAQGIHCARKRVARLMREQELFAQRPRHRTITTKSEKGVAVAPNLLQRDFSAQAPNTRMGG